MRITRFRISFGFMGPLLSRATASAREEGIDPDTLLFFGPVPEATASAAPPSEAGQREIRGWIRPSAEIGRDGVGFSPSLTGSGFAPHSRSERPRMAPLGPARPETADAFRKVVEARPDARPLLLQRVKFHPISP